ncbi:MAG: hypothetical protein BGO10_00905 [Chlamydia sp. 32-24]|nr:MAG: hypothetical protein BGO10_00905 [Chlamydia sp. 32-24]
MNTVYLNNTLTESNTFTLGNKSFEGKERLQFFERIFEKIRTFLNIPNKWSLLNVVYLKNENNKIHITTKEIFISTLSIVAHTGWESKKVATLCKTGLIANRLNNHFDSTHRQQNLGFSNRELVLAGIDSPTLSKIVPFVQNSFNGKSYYDCQKESITDKKATNCLSIKRQGNDIKVRRCRFTPLSGASKFINFRLNLSAMNVEVKTYETLSHDKKDEGKKIEKKIYKSLKNKHIVDCKKTKSTGSIRSYYLEYCTQGQLISNFSILSREEKLTAMQEAFLGLHTLHQTGYLHFDLHTGNFLMTEEEGKKVTKLNDFGNARKLAHINSNRYFQKIFSNPGWTANWTVFSPEMRLNYLLSTVNRTEKKAKRLNEEQRQKHQNRLKAFKKFQEALKMHKIEGQVITEKTDIWQLGLNLAFEWYKVDLSKLSSWKYVRTLPKFLHFLYFYAKRGFDPREMDHIQQLELELKTQNSPPEPINKNSVSYLFWRMLNKDQNIRPTAQEAAELINQIKLIKR